MTLLAPTGVKSVTDPAVKVKPGQIFCVSVPEAAPSHIEAQDITLDVVYEDAHLLVINKQAGMTVHPAPGSPDSTLVNALLAHCGDTLSGIGGVARPGIVHRLDKETSGLMVVAKHDNAHHALSDQLQDRTLSRIYRAVVWGAPVQAKGTVVGNIGRHPKHRQRMAVLTKGGREATTHYTVLERFGPDAAKPLASLIECKLETGRTHQIRVHMKHINLPLVGDPVYGKKGAPDMGLPRQALHAFRLAFIHPANNALMQFEAPLPEDMKALLEKLR